jgi:hypothetical protein
MTCERDLSVMEEVLELTCQNGFNGLDQAVSILVNEAMKIERSACLRAISALVTSVTSIY